MIAVDEDTEQLYEQAPCGLLSTTDDGCVVRVNETFLTWSGYRREDVVGTRFDRLMPVGDRILWATHCVPRLQLVGAVEESAVDVVTATGVRRPALLSARRTPAAGEVPALVRIVVFSARERRDYELELLGALRRAEASEAERREAQAELAHLVLHDSLTGLPNRAGLARALEAELAAGAEQRASHRVAVLFVDLDSFKAVNDSLGHAAGDALLGVVATRLASVLRPSATLARLSGDEFVVVERLAEDPAAPAAPAAEAGAVATRLLDVLREPVVLEGLEVVVSASIGVAVAEAGEQDAESLLRRADIAMYRAKAHGRGCWELHDPGQVDPEVHRLHRLGELRRAITAGQLRVYYQPRVHLDTGSLDGVEALVRWQHPERGLLPPAEFIDLAEQSGLIVSLGAHVLDAALAQAAAWAREGGPALEVAINVSARQLGDPGLAELVARSLARHAVPAHLITLEITETALMADAEAALATLADLKALGVKLSIDDFGTGYSSLTYLKTFPVDELKIDKSFVDGLTDGSQDTAIIASCIQLAHAMGIRAVAEGVETEAQRRALLALGCDLAQGYLIGRPAPADELRRSRPRATLGA